MFVRDIKTKTISVTENGETVMKVVPELDATGHEIEVWSIEIPRSVEAQGGGAIEAYVAAARAKPAESTTETPAKRGGKETAR